MGPQSLNPFPVKYTKEPDVQDLGTYFQLSQVLSELNQVLDLASQSPFISEESEL